MSRSAAARNATFNPDSVDQTTKNQWCRSEIDSCFFLCGGEGTTLDNFCESVGEMIFLNLLYYLAGATTNAQYRKERVQYTCTCSNNSSPANIAQYEGTIPNYICQRGYSECINADEGDRPYCQTCGSLRPSDAPTAISPSTTASSGIEAASQTSNTTQPAETSPATLSTPNAAATGLSSSTKIGIGVGVSLGVVSIVIIFACLLLLRKRRKQRIIFENTAHDGGKSGKSSAKEPVMQELDANDDGADVGAGVRELDAIESSPHSPELTGSPGQQRFELE